MLEQIARHGLIDLNIQCQGDLGIDEHHTIEDVGIALGKALSQAYRDKRGIDRYGFVLPMDEARALVALDLSGRPYLVFNANFARDYVGDVPTDMIEHFFTAWPPTCKPPYTRCTRLKRSPQSRGLFQRPCARVETIN